MGHTFRDFYDTAREIASACFGNYELAYAGIPVEGQYNPGSRDSTLDNSVFFGKFKPMKVRDLHSLITQHGGRLVRSKGGHKIYQMPDGRIGSVPHSNNNEDVRPGTLKNILRLLHIGRED